MLVEANYGNLKGRNTWQTKNGPLLEIKVFQMMRVVWSNSFRNIHISTIY